MVHGFIRNGWRVSGCARSTAAIESLTKEQDDGQTLFVACDVAEAAEVETFAAAVKKKLGVPDLLINNAAIMNRLAPLWEQTDEEIARILDVNVRATVSLIRSFLPAMAERRSGIVVNFSSGWGRSTSPEVASDCASKYAIEGLSAALAQELPSGLACVALNPGIIDTRMLRSCLGEAAGDYEDADLWAKRAVAFLSALDSSCNGKALTAP